jgi:hypothetical protein
MYTNTSSAIGDIGHFQKPLSRFDQDQISAEKNTSHTPLNSPNTALYRSHIQYGAISARPHSTI